MTVSFAYAKALRAAAASHFGGDGRDVSTLHKRCVEREQDSTRQTVLDAVFSAQDSWQELRAEEAYLRVDFSSAPPPPRISTLDPKSHGRPGNRPGELSLLQGVREALPAPVGHGPVAGEAEHDLLEDVVLHRRLKGGERGEVGALALPRAVVGGDADDGRTVAVAREAARGSEVVV